MSTYATIDDVQQRMPQFTLTETTRPTIMQAQTFLDDAHAHADAALTNLGYVVPITGALSVPQVREAVCDRAICRILFARGAAVGTDAAFQSAKACCDRYDKFLADLGNENSPVELVDAIRNDSAVLKPMNIGSMGLTEGSGGPPRIAMDSRVRHMEEF